MPRLSGPIVTDHLRIFTHDQPQPPINAIRTFGRNVAHLQKGDICLCRGGGLFIAVDVEDKADVIWFGFMPMDTAVSKHGEQPEPTRTQTVATHTPQLKTDPAYILDETLPDMTPTMLSILNEGGFRTIGDIQQASDDELLNLNGIGPSRLRWLRGL